MKQQILGLVALVVALGAIGLHFWLRPTKIGYAETSVLLAEFTEAIKAKKQFEESQKEWDKNLKTLNDSLTASMEMMKKSFDAANKQEKEKMRGELQQRNEDLQRYSNAVKNMSQDKEKDLMDPVVNKLNSFMELWGKQHGYDLLLGTMTGGNILRANSDLNVTAAILKDLNEHYRDLPIDGDSSVTTDTAKAKTTAVVKESKQ